MTGLLVRLFIKNPQDTGDPAVRGAYGRMAGLVGIVCNLVLVAGKLVAGFLSGSIAIMADAVNNLSDASASIITLIGFKLAAKPADKEHPFGHARFEYLAGLAVAVLIMAIGLNLAKGSVEKIIAPTPVDYSVTSFIVLGASILVKVWMMRFNTTIGVRIGSQTLQATAADSRNDVISTAAVLVAALVARFTGLALDGWMGLAVAVFILISGFLLIRETLDPILGAAPSPELVERVGRKILSYNGVLATHDLMVHDYGPGRRFASAHVEMSSDVDALHSHDIIDDIERDFLKDEGIHLVLHYDPVATGDEAVDAARAQALSAVRRIDACFSIHDFRMVDGPGHVNYLFDVVVPPDYATPEEELKECIQREVRAVYGAATPDQPSAKQVYTVITVDRSFAPIPESGTTHEKDW